MNAYNKNIVITSAVRTAIGTFRGSLKDMQAHDLGALITKAVMKKSNLNPHDVDELIMGQVLTAATGQNPARQAAIQAGIPTEKTAYVINQVCGSGLRSVAAGYQAIISNDSNIVIAGGQESMSNAPHAININDGKKLEEILILYMRNTLTNFLFLAMKKKYFTYSCLNSYWDSRKNHSSPGKLYSNYCNCTVGITCI